MEFKEKSPQEILENRVRQYQRKTFGTTALRAERYVGASMSQMKWSKDEMQKVYSFMKEKKNFLVILGSPGTSKTYLCSALSEWVLDNFQTYRYWMEGNLFERLKRGFESHEGSPKVLEYLIDDELIILDDVGSNSWTEWKEDIFFDLVNMRYNSMMPTIITSNLTRKQFYDTYQPRVTSRLFAKENTVIELKDAQDFREAGM
jgi:DNA replication protein DnaC